MTTKTLKSEYRLDIQIPPPRMRRLPIDRGYPVPWFVPLVNGKFEFRMADAAKRSLAVLDRLCWVCGQRLIGKRMAFVIGPMCGVNRISAEPPSHEECAIYSVNNCPFLTKPNMDRRAHDEVRALSEASKAVVPGVMLEHNPGVSLVWITEEYKLLRDLVGGGVLFSLGDPLKVTFHTKRRSATREEMERAVINGVPNLLNLCKSLE